ncbi:MAG: flagellar biosynthetic protein FliO [Lachnospiraceae bacterium]|nr:flagellar biosynthetic protein FliO [Lachnospiraceae bacterium]MEE3460443.1 flagellar biosynthetic protein FliO [Lachnospiraceae bacterium]
MSTASGLLSLLGLLVLMVAILFAAHYVTKWYAGSGLIRSHSRNMKVIETLSCGPGRDIMIVKVGNRYYLLSATKDRIEYLTEVSSDDIFLPEDPKASEAGNITFKEAFMKEAGKYFHRSHDHMDDDDMHDFNGHDNNKHNYNGHDNKLEYYGHDDNIQDDNKHDGHDQE